MYVLDDLPVHSVSERGTPAGDEGTTAAIRLDTLGDKTYIHTFKCKTLKCKSNRIKESNSLKTERTLYSCKHSCKQYYIGQYGLVQYLNRRKHNIY